MPEPSVEPRLPRQKAPARWRKALPLLGLLLLAWVLSRIDLHALGSAFGRISGRAVLEAALLFAFNLLLKSFRWQRMLVIQDLRLPTPVAIAAFLSSQFYGQVTLGRLGELYRAEALIERGVPLGMALSSSFYDRLLDLALVVLVAAVLGASVFGDWRLAVWAGSSMLFLIGFGIAVLRARALSRFSAVARLRAFIDARKGTPGMLGLGASLAAGLGPLLRPGFLLEAMVWTLVAWFGYFASLWCVAVGMGLVVTPVLLTAGAAFGALSALLPVTISGIGAREVIFMHVLALEHVSAEHAVVLSLLHLSIMMGVAIALGLMGVLARHQQQRVAALTQVERPGRS